MLSAVRESMAMTVPRARCSPPLASLAGGGESQRCVWASSVQHPGILGAAALAGVDDQRAGLQGDAREAARHDADAIAAGQHERPKVHMARRKALLDQCRHRGEGKGRLGNEAARVALELLTESFDRHL